MQQLLPRTTSSQSCQLTFSNLRAIRCRMSRAVFRGTLGHGDKTTISRDSAKRHFSRLTSYFISGVIIQLLLAIGLAESHYYIALTFGYTHKLPITEKSIAASSHSALSTLQWQSSAEDQNSSHKRVTRPRPPHASLGSSRQRPCAMCHIRGRTASSPRSSSTGMNVICLLSVFSQQSMPISPKGPCDQPFTQGKLLEGNFSEL